MSVDVGRCSIKKNCLAQILNNVKHLNQTTKEHFRVGWTHTAKAEKRGPDRHPTDTVPLITAFSGMSTLILLLGSREVIICHFSPGPRWWIYSRRLRACAVNLEMAMAAVQFL